METIRNIFVNDFSELKKNNDLQINEITQNALIFLFFTNPKYELYKRNRNLNETITSLLIKVCTDYADMQEDS